MEPDLNARRSVRCFIAIELERDVLRALDSVQADLKKQIRGNPVRWVGTGSIHLTLKFLGDVPVERVPDIICGLERAAAGFGPFSLSLGGLGCFPNLNRPRVVWVGVHEPSGTLAGLQQAVEDRIAPLGYPTEDRGFTPHLTLGRAARDARPDELKQVGQVVAGRSAEEMAGMGVHEVSLMRSDLRPTGALYTCLRAVALGDRP